MRKMYEAHIYQRDGETVWTMQIVNTMGAVVEGEEFEWRFFARRAAKRALKRWNRPERKTEVLR